MRKLRHSYQATVIILIIAVSFVQVLPNVQAQSTTPPSLPESHLQLYVIYNHPELKTFSIELRNQKRNPDGSVTANIAVRSEGLIAYNLTFDQSHTTGDYWEDVNFLPLYPNHIYEIATITIKPGGHFKIQGTKFGLDESVLSKMTLVQMCILVMHLVGATPPVDTYELGQAAAESFDNVPGISGAIASFGLFGYELLGKEKEPVQAILDLGDGISEFDSGANFIADGINLITKGNGKRITGSTVKNFFTAINIFETISDAKRAINAFKELRDFPPLIEATITLAPEISSQPDRYRVFEINQSFYSEFSFKNKSSEIWTSEQGYELWLIIESTPVRSIPLATTIPRNKDALWKIQQIAPAIPGIYHLKYQMAINGIPIGMPIKAEIVVVPEKSDNLQDLIQAMIDEAKQEAGDRFEEILAELERRILEAILNEIARRLQEICGGTGMLILAGILPVWMRKQNYLRKNNE